MIRLCHTLLLFSWIVYTSAQNARFNNAYDLGSSEIGEDIISLYDGYLVTAGGPFNGLFRILFLKIDFDGNLTVDTSYSIYGNSSSFGRGQAVIEYDSGYIAAGWFNDTIGSHPYLLKVNQSLDSLWCDTLMIRGSYFELSRGKKNDLAAAGWRYSQGQEDQQFMLSLYDSNLNLIEMRDYGLPAFHEKAYAIARCPDGGYILSGYRWDGSWDSNPYIVKTDSLGNFEWEREFVLTEWGEQAAHVHVDDLGYIYVVSDLVYEHFSSFNFSRVYLAKLKPSGELLWEKEYGDSVAINRITAIKERRDGSLLLSGYSNAEIESNPIKNLIGRVLNVDTSGLEIFEHYFELLPDPTYDSISGKTHYVHSLDTTSDNGFIVAGYVSGYFPQDLWVVKFDSNGCYDTVFNNCLVGVDERYSREDLSMFVYPNPASDVVNIDYTLPQGSTKAVLAVYGIDGRRLKFISLMPSEQTAQLNLNSFAPGIYFCNLTVEGHVLAGQKFIVVK